MEINPSFIPSLQTICLLTINLERRGMEGDLLFVLRNTGNTVQGERCFSCKAAVEATSRRSSTGLKKKNNLLHNETQSSGGGGDRDASNVT